MKNIGNLNTLLKSGVLLLIDKIISLIINSNSNNRLIVIVLIVFFHLYLEQKPDRSAPFDGLIPGLGE